MKATLFKGVALGAITSTLVLGAAAALAGTGVGSVFNLGENNSADAQSSLTGQTGNAQLFVDNHGTGRGIVGFTDSTTSSGQAVLGRVFSTTPDALSAGVRGVNNGTTANGYGVWGSHAGSGAGVYGTSHAGAGVKGYTSSTAPNATGVLAQNDGGGSALSLLVNNGTIPPMKVNSAAKVDSLNADLLDGQDSSGFLSSAPGSVGSSSLADGAVTNTKVGPDVIRHVRYYAARTSGGNAMVWNFGSMTLGATCYTSFGISLGVSNNDSTLSMRENFSWIDTGNAAHAKQILLPHNTSAYPLVQVSSGSGTGNLVSWMGTRTVSGSFTYYVDANHCEFYGNLVQAGAAQN